MKKRVFSLLLTLAMMLSMAPAALAASGSLDNFEKSREYAVGQFTDVSDSAWYAAGVKNAYELGLVNGSSASTFNPDGNITVVETLALASRLHDIYNGGDGVFEQGSPWYQVYIDYAVEQEIIAPDAYETYTVSAKRSDFASIMAAAFPEKALKAINEIERIPDVDESADFAEAVYLLYNAGILTGSDAQGTFNPDSNIRRSEVATIVTRMADTEQRKSFELIDPTVLCQENLQGRWVHYSDNKMDDEYVFSGDTFVYSSSYRGYYTHFSGTFTVEGENLILTGKYIHRIAGQEPTLDEEYQETQPIFHFDGTSFTEFETYSSPFTKTDDPNIDFAAQVMAEINYRDPVPTAEEYAHLVGSDFRSIRRTYSSAKAQAGYVIVYKDSNGDWCALTYVRYKIIDNYYETVLHNLTDGTTIKNPSNYYANLANRAYGANRLAYMDLRSEVMGKELQAMKAVSNVLSTGVNNGPGVYVSPSAMG